jgi:hypothetical protein
MIDFKLLNIMFFLHLLKVAATAPHQPAAKNSRKKRVNKLFPPGLRANNGTSVQTETI